MKMLRWPNVSLPLGPPPLTGSWCHWWIAGWVVSDTRSTWPGKFIPIPASLYTAAHPSIHCLTASLMGGPGQIDFQKKSEWGQGLRGAIILPYFRIYFSPIPLTFFFHLPSFLEEMERKERFHCLLIQFKRDKPARRYMNHFLLFTSMSHILNINLPNWLGCTRI